MHTPIELTFAELINDPHSGDPLHGCAVSLVDLIYLPSTGVKVGTFKKAQFGVVHKQPVGQSVPTLNRVCIKQCIRRTSPATSPSTSSSHQVVVYDNIKQAELLTTELNCMRWGKGLMGLCYNFIRVGIALDGDPPQPIPEMSFVSISLAVGVDGPRDTFLLEDIIDPRKEGRFVKYISNNSAKPIVFQNDPDKTRIAQFLSFCQHVQYIKTRNLAFVSDFQGMLSFLHFNSHETFLTQTLQVVAHCSRIPRSLPTRKSYSSSTSVLLRPCS